MFLSVVHLRDLPCHACNEMLATAGARSFIVGSDGNPMNFSEEDPPAEMVVQLACRNGHVTELNVPNEISAEESLQTPDDAPIGVDAYAVSGTTEGGRSIFDS
jgi:hypothetical protein